MYGVMNRPPACDQAEMVAHIYSLSSGTVAGLAGSPRYDDIDAYREAWADWVKAQSYRRRWATWHDCHCEFAVALAARWRDA